MINVFPELCPMSSYLLNASWTEVITALVHFNANLSRKKRQPLMSKKLIIFTQTLKYYTAGTNHYKG